MHNATKFIASFFPQHVSPEVKELYISTLMIDFGTAMVALFEPIYLFSIGYSLQQIMFFFLIVYAVYLLIMPLGARFASYFGTEKSIAVSTIFITLLYIALYGIQFSPWLFYVAAVIYSLQKAFYWPAYHADFAQHIIVRESSRAVGGFKVTATLVYVIGPISAGAIIAFGGFEALFIVVSTIFLLSNLPLLSTAEKFSRHSFSYRESFKVLFSHKNFRNLRAYLGYAEDFVLLVIWPIFISVIVGNNFEVGLLAGLSLLVPVVIILVAGRFMDQHNKNSLLRLSSITYAITWLAKMFIRTPWAVFVVGSASWLAKDVVDLSMMAITYTRAHAGRVMSAVVAFESGLVLGKLAMILLLYIIFGFLNSNQAAFDVSFIAAGISSLLYMLL